MLSFIQRHPKWFRPDLDQIQTRIFLVKWKRWFIFCMLFIYLFSKVTTCCFSSYKAWANFYSLWVKHSLCKSTLIFSSANIIIIPFSQSILTLTEVSQQHWQFKKTTSIYQYVASLWMVYVTFVWSLVPWLEFGCLNLRISDK